MAAYTSAGAFSVEGARVGFVTCLWCGAALILDARDAESPMEIHDKWHAEQAEKERRA